MLYQTVSAPPPCNDKEALWARPCATNTKYDTSDTALSAARFLHSSGILVAAMVYALVLALSSRALGQAAYTFTSPVAVGDASQAQTIPVRLQTAGVFSVVEVLTQGSPNLDFSLASPMASCPTGAGQICKVAVSFSPKYPGVRLGAVVIHDTFGNIMARQNISGVGIGSLSVMTPGEITTVAGDGCLGDGSCLTSGKTAATASAISLPLGEATDAAGNLYISDTGNNRIEKVDLHGNITTVAGLSKVAGYLGDDGPAFSAQLSAPSAIAVDGAGDILFADTGNHAIRKINVIDGTISTIAGTLGSAGSGSVHLTAPQGFATDASGSLYIADTGNSRVVKVDPLGNLVVIPGTYHEPWGIAISAKDGSVYTADLGLNCIVRTDTSGNVSIVAGNGTAGYSGDGHLATNATLNSPASVTLDAADNLYIADSENNVIRRVASATGDISTLVGNGTALFSGDGSNAIVAGLNKPYSVYLDGAGDLFIADRLNLRIREVSATVAALQFPTMKEGKTSAPIAQELANDGNAPLNLTNLRASPATINAGLDTVPADPVTTTCSVSQPIGIGAICALAVEFMPLTVGAPGTGLLSVTSDAGNDPVDVILTGIVLSVDPTSTTVTSTSNPAAVDQGITFVATITSPNGVTGTVQFFDGPTQIGLPQAVISASNTASIETSLSTLGTHIITAVYGGDNLNAASTPNTPIVQVIEQATALSVIPSANPAVEFTPITFTAALSGWTTTPTGSITFTDGATSLGAASLDGAGIARFAVPPLSVGKHSVVATFAGDANDFSSQYSFFLTVTLASSSTVLHTSNAVAQFGTPISFTATVTGVRASTPTGAVAFLDGTSTLSTVLMDALGSATYDATKLAAGTHTITAVYQGDGDYSGSTSAQIITETIQQTATSTTVSSTTTRSISGRPVTLTATVSAPDSIPTGSIRFMNGNIVIGTGILNKGVVSLTLSSLPVGTDNVAAVYSGDANNTMSVSPPLAIEVVQTPTTTLVSSSQNPLLTSSSVVISAFVSNQGAQSPTGLVTFVEDGISIGIGTLNASGVATITISSLPAGSHTFSARYAGDTQNLASSSPSIVEGVQLRPTVNVLTTSSTSLNGGQQLTLIAVIRVSGPAASVRPTGAVVFMSGTTTLATSPLDAAGVASVTVLLPGTSATISSKYSGDPIYESSSSSPTLITIGPAANFSLQVTPTSWQMQSKQHVSATVTLTSVKSFTDSFVLGCLGLPENATCTFSHDKTDLPSGGTTSVSLTVDTGTPLLGGTQARYANGSGIKVFVACMLPGSLALCFLSFSDRRRLVSGLLLAILFVITSGISGCGSIQNSGTPPGTYSFLVTATGQTGVSQFTTMTMTITK